MYFDACSRGASDDEEDDDRKEFDVVVYNVKQVWKIFEKFLVL